MERSDTRHKHPNRVCDLLVKLQHRTPTYSAPQRLSVNLVYCAPGEEYLLLSHVAEFGNKFIVLHCVV